LFSGWLVLVKRVFAGSASVEALVLLVSFAGTAKVAGCAFFCFVGFSSHYLCRLAGFSLFSSACAQRFGVAACLGWRRAFIAQASIIINRLSPPSAVVQKMVEIHCARHRQTPQALRWPVSIASASLSGTGYCVLTLIASCFAA
jgi:hypothetical protein